MSIIIRNQYHLPRRFLHTIKYVFCSKERMMIKKHKKNCVDTMMSYNTRAYDKNTKAEWWGFLSFESNLWVNASNCKKCGNYRSTTQNNKLQCVCSDNIVVNPAFYDFGSETIEKQRNNRNEIDYEYDLIRYT